MILAAAAFYAAILGPGQLADPVKIEIGKPLKIALQSAPVEYKGNKLHVFSAGQCTFQLENRITGLHQEPPEQTIKPGLYGFRWGRFPEAREPQFKIEFGTGLKVTLKAAVAQYNTFDYRISAAVFDANGNLLGTAHAVKPVQYVRLGYMLTVFRDIELDFGVSKSYENAALAMFSVSNPNVPKPPDAG